MKKTCFRCGKELDIEMFYRHPRMADGRLGKCKDCTREDVTTNRNAKIDKVRAYDRLRGVTQKRIKSNTRNTKRWRAKSPRKYAAHNLLNNAIRDGKLKSKPCERCGAEKVHAHHENYDKPLEVVWLCTVHHHQRHKEMKAAGIVP